MHLMYTEGHLYGVYLEDGVGDELNQVQYYFCYYYHHHHHHNTEFCETNCELKTCVEALNGFNLSKFSTDSEHSFQRLGNLVHF